ncbi:MULTISPECIES: AAA family ATPase [Staphylococcus]|uniref:Uncharacterized protein n=2 Tax=Staphylococcus TaxID=1279 RepID=A0ABX3Z256_9STAP|nr:MULTISPECIES: AAA family ATPase [Staphylococcus]AJC95837.1 hypothetical protein SHYC_05405 [Staphylococcus hyicus]MDG4943884.1 AAA family ATPase [Staphylococcus agnetis]MDP4462559.1 AAA family ATPase [Staphylococcus hyicus]MDP4468625.1 AAA family ATPase [Staphylococcus hyicus]MDY3698774.1 AAA family ATPase [Staphylococcus hyicus]
MKNTYPVITKVNNFQINIALTGKMRSGKDTVAKKIFELFDAHDVAVKHYAFGDALKTYARKLYPDEFNEGNKPRELFQWLGQTLRERNPNIWINHLAEEINKFNGYYGTVYYGGHLINIITDLRQPNEYEFCKDNDFYIIRVDCDDVVRLKRMKTLNDNFSDKDLNHETEKHIDSFKEDYIVTTTHINEEELSERIESIINHIKNKQLEKVRGN